MNLITKNSVSDFGLRSQTCVNDKMIVLPTERIQENTLQTENRQVKRASLSSIIPLLELLIVVSHRYES